MIKRHAWIIATLAGLAGIVVGLGQGHWGIVLVWARTLCTSCIGLSD